MQIREITQDERGIYPKVELTNMLDVPSGPLDLSSDVHRLLDRPGG